jgi:hypothetical protein
MNAEALFLFLILLLGLVLCSFLGGNCGNEGFSGEFSGTITTKQTDNNNKNNTTSTNGSSTNGASTSSNVNYDNYNHFNGSSTQLASGTTFYGPNGGSVVVNTDSNGQQSLQVTLANGQQPMIFSSSSASTPDSKESYTNYYGNNGTATTYYGPNGDTATVANGNNGQQAINVQTSSGSYIYTQSGSNPDDTTSTQYYGSTGTPIQQSGSSLAYQGPYGGSAGSVTGPQGNTASYAQGPQGNTVAGTSSGGYGDQYYSTMPQGISKSQIPDGQEDLYILKSQIVPPVCPVCPVGAACPRQEKCPPCPACARCPEPSFECKKVPNYNAIGNDQLPIPVLNNFSSFGM